MVKLSDGIIEVQRSYKDKLEEATRHNTPPALEFKKYSGGMGVYPQKVDGHFMIRPRIYSGIISIDQLSLINDLAKKYAKAQLHLTTRQSFQLHKVALKDTWPIMESLLEIGIITVGAGGNGIRNISIPPLAGVDPEEVFDVTPPHAVAATNFIFSLEDIKSLPPRKYKIAFSGDERDIAKATISDLGFVAKLKGKKRGGFRLYGGGGVGANPEPSIIIRDFIDEKDILYHILAMKELFDEHGDRTNRNKARIRYIVKRLGEKEFVELYDAYLKKIKKDHHIDYIHKDEEVKNEVVSRSIEADGFRIIAQKDTGLYALYVHPKKGDIDSSQVDILLEFLEKIKDRAQVRLSNTQGLYIRNLTAKEVLMLDELTKDLSITNRFRRSVSCTGAANCKIGRSDSQQLLERIHQSLASHSNREIDLLPEVRISGCRNSCALHQTFPLGFEGSGLKTDQGVIEAYKVFVGGKVSEYETLLSESVGTLTVDKVIELFSQLIDLIKDQGQKDFESLWQENPEVVVELVERLAGETII